MSGYTVGRKLGSHEFLVQWYMELELVAAWEYYSDHREQNLLAATSRVPNPRVFL